MGNAYVDYLRSMNPAVVAAACIPFLVCAAVWFYFYIKYNRKVLKKLESTFRRINSCTKNLMDCKMENLDAMDEVALDSTTLEFAAAWQKMKGQVRRRYTEEVLPEASSFFRKAAIIDVPAHRGSVKTIWGVSILLMLLSVLLPLITETVMNGHANVIASSAGLLPAGLILVGLLLFSGLDNLAHNKTLEAYQRFLFLFDTVLPTADGMAGPALLLDASRKNQKAFEAATETMVTAFSQDTEKISDAIDAFSNGGVLPALHAAMKELTVGFIVPAMSDIKDTLNETLDQVVMKQESGIRELTDSFAARLADTLELRMNKISDGLSQYQSRMEEQNSLYQERIDALNGLLAQNMREFSDFMENQKEILCGSAEVLKHADELYQQETENAMKRNEHENKMLEIINEFRSQTEKFAQDAMAFTMESGKAQQSFGVLVTSITERMQESLMGAGREIASGINKAVGDNAKAIADLTVQSQALREDYETFFQRREESTKQTLDEMDYQMQGLITRMSEDIGTMLKASVEENGSILSQYKNQTADLLQSFDEQARSIGLYAREINMDISDLSKNLGASVTEFNEKIREGILLTVSDFDKGFAELAGRIANTVESIADAVENLPASIRAEKTGKIE